MSRYALDVYGAAYYGEPGLVDFDTSPFVAVSLNHGELQLSWTSPGGTYGQMRLVRSSYGNPINQDDGTVLLDTADASVVRYTDGDLTESAFFYYSLFVQQTIGLGFKWVRVGDTFGLVVANMGYGALLLERLPSIFTTSPASTAAPYDIDRRLP